MKRNTAGQFTGAQMVSAADGSPFTGSVSVFVVIDNGSQAAGAGTVTHKGNGFHSYAPTQAETNGDRAAFTFTGTGAVPATVHYHTTFPQTGDNFARIGAPAGASIAADLAAVKADTAVTREYADNTVIRGTVASGSATSLTPSALTPAGVLADQFKGRILVFDTDTTTAALRGQATDITASSAAALSVLTFTALNSAPAAGDTFSIV